jgi:TubC N-terminal docking domain
VSAAEILAELGARNVRPVLVGDKLRLRGQADSITPALVERVRQHKAALLVHLSTERDRDEALAVLQRLKIFTLYGSRTAAAREIAQGCADGLICWQSGEPLDEADDPASILAAVS